MKLPLLAALPVALIACSGNGPGPDETGNTPPVTVTPGGTPSPSPSATATPPATVVDGQPFGPEAVREQALRCRAWLSSALAQPATADATVVITHYAPSLRSADPRYGAQPTTASFCNADDDLLQHADLWVHGHLHVRHDYQAGRCRVVCQARGVEKKGETAGFDAHALFCV